MQIVRLILMINLTKCSVNGKDGKDWKMVCKVFVIGLCIIKLVL